MNHRPQCKKSILCKRLNSSTSLYKNQKLHERHSEESDKTSYRPRESMQTTHLTRAFPPDSEYSTVKTPNFVSKGTKKLENTLPKAIQQTRTWRDTHEHWSSGTHKIKTLWEGAGQSEKPPLGWENIQKTGEQGQPLRTVPRAFSRVALCRGTGPQQSQEATAPLCGFAGRQGEP